MRVTEELQTRDGAEILGGRGDEPEKGNCEPQSPQACAEGCQTRRTGALGSWAKNELLLRVGDPDIFVLAAVICYHGAEGPGTQSLCQSCNTRR